MSLIQGILFVCGGLNVTLYTRGPIVNVPAFSSSTIYKASILEWHVAGTVQ